jgi:hypothetical protein
MFHFNDLLRQVRMMAEKIPGHPTLPVKATASNRQEASTS